VWTDAVTYLAAYAAVRERLVGVIDVSRCDTPVPACPDWRVRELVAHLTGLCEDWVADRLDGYASEKWTSTQISRYEDHTCREVLDVWRDSMGSFARLDVEMFGLPAGVWAFGDAVIHEADIRGALGADRVPEEAVVLGLNGMMQRWHREVLSRADVSTLRVRARGVRDWLLGADDRGADDRGADDRGEVVVEAPLYELFRALAGRRSADQFRSWSWSDSAEPFVQAGLPYPFKWAEADLSED
jgi:uncharacterized protein (TIGR03083 family)